MKGFKFCAIFVATLMVLPIYAQETADGKWSIYSGDPAFMTLSDTIDRGRVLYHKDAQNYSTLTGNRGVLFPATFVAFPSLNGSLAWSQVRINQGSVSFYPHIFTAEGGESTLSLAILYNIARISPVRGVRTRPSFTPVSVAQLERDRMNFTRLKFVSEGYSIDINLQVANQETEMSQSDYEVSYTYWLKSRPNKQESDNLKAFFTRPLKSFKIRAYSDKGYLDTTIDGSKVAVVSDVFVKSIGLYERLLDPRAAAELAAAEATPPAAAPSRNVAPAAPPVVAPTTNAAPRQPAATRRAARQPAATRQPATTNVTTNQRATTTRVAVPTAAAGGGGAGVRATTANTRTPAAGATGATGANTRAATGANANARGAGAANTRAARGAANTNATATATTANTNARAAGAANTRAARGGAANTNAAATNTNARAAGAANTRAARGAANTNAAATANTNARAARGARGAANTNATTN